MDRKEHWEDVYARKAPTEVSWFQPRPETSLALVREAAVPATARIIDVGGGASRLVDALLDAGYADVTVLDVSGRALAHARERLGDRADQVRWVEADVVEAELEGPYDLWHDRAVFHFLTDAADRQRYLDLLRRNTRSGSQVVIATFAEDGPERCSGLPVVRYAPEALAAELGPDFEPTTTHREVHRTPAGKEQRFVYCSFRRA